MNSLFNEEELKNLYSASLYTDEMRNAPDFDRREENFVQKADAVFDAFGEETIDSYLFGNMQSEMPIRMCFLPLFRYIKNLFKDDHSDWFCVGAFDKWEESFCTYLEQLFGNMIFALLEEAVGEMTTPSIKWYEEKASSFINSGKLYKLIAKQYPLCARQLVEFTYLQAEHIREIIDAIEKELPGLYGSFFLNREMPKIKEVGANDSDKHNGGRSVHILIFETGEKLVYKPHNLKMDRAWKAWLDYCADKAGISRFVFPVCADTARGGFSSFIKPEPLTEDDASEYFFRIGFLIGMVYLTGGGDLHCENIIAVGSDPVFIDTETLIEPKSCLLNRILSTKTKHSVINMCILPMMLSFPGLSETNFAGLCYSMPGSANLPVYNGRTISGRDYAGKVSGGFSLAVHTVTDNAKESSQMFSGCFDNVPVRSVIRATAGYMRVLGGLCNKSCQSDASQYSAIINRIKISSDKLSAEDINLINREESEALDRLDIPFFSEPMTPSMAGDVTVIWKDITAEDIKREEERLFFGLTKAGPKSELTSVADEKSQDAGDFSREAVLDGMRRMADELAAMLDKKRTPVAVAEQQDDYIVNIGLQEYSGILEGNLGIMVALAAYCNAAGQEGDFYREKLMSHKAALLDPSCAAPALTPGELSLSSGGAGYLLGCFYLFRMGIFTEDEFVRAVHNLDAISENLLKVKYSKYMTIYGSYDMLYALSIIPDRYITDTLREVREYLLGEIGDKYTEKQICKMVEDDLYCAKSSMEILSNNTLRFGNAGKLLYYANMGEILSEEKEYVKRLAMHLAKAEHVLGGVSYPEGYLETGLIHGMPGVLYSLCRYMAPDTVAEF